MIRLNGAHAVLLLCAADLGLASSPGYKLWIETMASKDVEVKLLTACERGELHVVRELVESKAVDPRKVTEWHYYRHLPNVGSTRVEGYTPLHYACL